VVQKKPKFETGIADCGIDSLPSRLTQGLRQIPDVRSFTTVIDI
jgi:hypothetical protein